MFAAFLLLDLGLPVQAGSVKITPTPSGPPSLKSSKYLNDLSLIKLDPPSCLTPCFHGIIPGKTTFNDAVDKLKSDKAFSDIQVNDHPLSAGWSAASSGEACCQMTANQSGIVDALVVKVAANMTLRQVIYKYGQPQYAFPVDYTTNEVALAAVYPDRGIVVWVSPGGKASYVDGNARVVIILYFAPADWETKYKPSAELQAWAGYKAYQNYQSATPVITPAITETLG